MSTYQEQLRKLEESKVTKALVAMAELGQLHESLLILVRDGIIESEDRLLFCRAFVMKHPEINKAIREASPAAMQAVIKEVKK